VGGADRLRLSGQRPAGADRGAWIQTRPDLFRLQQQEESIRAILKVGLDHNDDALTETATAIVRLCIAEGLDLREILSA
jgi:hypothetical protein